MNNNTIKKIAFKHKNHTNENGASLVEFAIILPVFIIIIFGIIEFGLLFYNKGIITHAAREGARVGVVYNYGTNPSDDNRISIDIIKTEVDKYIKNNLVTFSSSAQDNPTTSIFIDSKDNDGKLIWVQDKICPNNASSNKKLKVEVKFFYSFLILPYSLKNPLQSEAVMICE